jgi:tetratricopeptide (TPR) repeat protein
MTKDSTSKRPSRGLVVGLSVVLAILLLGLAALAFQSVGPRLKERLSGQPTPTVSSPTPTLESSTETPVETPVPTPLPTEAEGALGAQQFEDLLAQAEAVALRSKFDEATSIYDYLLQWSPDDVRVLVGKAWMLVYDAQAGEALPYAQRAVEVDPSDGDAATVLSRAYADTGDKATALTAAQQAAKLDEGSAEAHAVLADAYRLNGQSAEAVREAELALVLDTGSANAHRARGLLYEAVEQDMGLAAGELQVAAGLEPELWLRRHELGLLLAADGNNGAAVDAFQDALKLRPKAETYAGIGGAYYRQDQYELATAALLEASQGGVAGQVGGVGRGQGICCAGTVARARPAAGFGG